MVDRVAVGQEGPGRAVGRSTGSAPFQVSSRNEPRWSRLGPETVPEAYRSPVRSEAPLTVRWASCCAGRPVHRRERRRGRPRPFQSHRRARGRRPALGVAQVGQHRRVLRRRRTRAAASASSGTTHGETEVAKDLPRNGPSGWYSQAWMSRADQSLTQHHAEDVVGEVAPSAPAAERRRHADHEPDLGLDVEPPRRARRRALRVGRLALPGRAHDGGAGDHDRAGAAVVADRQVLPVRRQRRRRRGGRSARRSSAWCSRGVEVDVVGDLERQVQRRRRRAARSSGSTGPGAGVGEQLDEPLPDRASTCGRPEARNGLRVGCRQRAAGRRAARPPRRAPGRAPVADPRTPIRGRRRRGAERPRTAGCARRTGSRRQLDPGCHASTSARAAQPDQVGRAGPSTLRLPKPTHSGRGRAGAARAGSTSGTGCGRRRAPRRPRRPRRRPRRPGRGDQHVEEAVVGEAGLRVGVPHRVVQPGGQLERQVPVPAGADHRGQLDRGREQFGGQAAGAELRRRPQRRAARRLGHGVERRRAGPSVSGISAYTSRSLVGPRRAGAARPGRAAGPRRGGRRPPRRCRTAAPAARELATAAGSAPTAASSTTPTGEARPARQHGSTSDAGTSSGPSRSRVPGGRGAARCAADGVGQRRRCPAGSTAASSTSPAKQRVAPALTRILNLMDASRGGQHVRLSDRSYPYGRQRMPYYRSVGEVPRKRHTQFRRPDGGLYAEELMGQEGFSSDSSLLYHRHLPTAIVAAEAYEPPRCDPTAEPAAQAAPPAHPQARRRPGRRGARPAGTCWPTTTCRISLRGRRPAVPAVPQRDRRRVPVRRGRHAPASRPSFGALSVGRRRLRRSSRPRSIAPDRAAATTRSGC